MGAQPDLEYDFFFVMCYKGCSSDGFSNVIINIKVYIFGAESFIREMKRFMIFIFFDFLMTFNALMYFFTYMKAEYS